MHLSDAPHAASPVFCSTVAVDVATLYDRSVMVCALGGGGLVAFMSLMLLSRTWMCLGRQVCVFGGGWPYRGAPMAFMSLMPFSRNQMYLGTCERGWQVS